MAIRNEDVIVVEWPTERNIRLNNHSRADRRFSDVPPEFRREVERVSAFEPVVGVILDAFKDRADPQVTLAELTTRVAQPDAYADYDDFGRRVVEALACLAALRQKPERAMWEHLWSLARHSAALEHYLPEAVISASSDSEFRQQFFAIARSVIELAAQQPGRRAMPQEAHIGLALRAQWQEHHALSSLFRGRFDHSFHAVDRDDDRILRIIAEIDAAEFVALLAMFDYPDPVASAFFWGGVPWRFERWKDVVLAAPVAFSEDSAWNSSLILPLLLGIARNQFTFPLRQPATSEQVAEATKEIKILATEVASVLGQRKDALGCLTRWGNWLIRSAVGSSSQNPVDASSNGFIDDAIFEALAAQVATDRFKVTPAPESESWEPWCQYVAGVLLALPGKASMPSPTTFLDEWRFGPEDWAKPTGHALKEHARPFDGSGSRADGYGARLLALPMLEHPFPETLWSEFWASTQTLREVVEFGDSDLPDHEGWEGRSSAARLLILQFSIGLMMMDQLIAPPRPVAHDRRMSLEVLLRHLDGAVREMMAIDYLNTRFWNEAVRHLAIRRAAWLSGSTTDPTIAFDDATVPTLVDFVRSLEGDTEQLLSLAFIASQNHVSSTTLAKAFIEGGIDSKAEIDLAERLLKKSPRSLNLNELQIQAARKALLEGG